MPENIEELDGRHTPELLSSYREFWRKLSGIAECGASQSADNIDVGLADGKVTIGTDTDSDLLRFKSLPLGRDDPGNQMDICVQFQHTIRGRRSGGRLFYEISKATTWVSYLERNGHDSGRVNAAINQAIHFDFDVNPDANHPIFHVQYDPTSVKLGVLRDIYNIDDDDLDNNTPNYPRIPSAPMDFLSVVYLILNDHVPGVLEESHGWPSSLQSKVGDLPAFPEECFEHDPQNGTGMVSDWWYIHATAHRTDMPTRRVHDGRLSSPAANQD